METIQENNFMKNYTKLAAVAALLLGYANPIQADHHQKTKKAVEAKSKPAQKKPDPKEARKRYAAAVKKIREAQKAGKLTDAEAKEKYSALRKRMAGYTNSRTSGSRADILKKFDKNKDGKLDDKERAEARKSMSEWRKKSSAKGKPNARRGDKGSRREGDKRRSRSSRKSKR
jgi:hypothetical protein